jgi:hypothetical protein
MAARFEMFMMATQLIRQTTATMFQAAAFRRASSHSRPSNPLVKAPPSALAYKLGRAFYHMLHTKEVLDINCFVRR